MKKILEALKSARRIELFFVIAAAAILLLQWSGSSNSAGGRTILEKRLESVLGQVQGVHRISVMVSQNESGTPEGVLIVTDAAQNISACLQLQYAVKTLLGVDLCRIEIVQSE